MTPDPPWLIRRLQSDDLPRFKPLRLQALRDHPGAIGSSVEEKQDSDLSHWFGPPPNLTVGAFNAAGALQGTASLMVPPKVKQRPKGHISGVYVTPPARGAGLARSLIGHLIARARARKLVVLTMSVSAGNETARRLYQSAGFTCYGTEPDSLTIGSKLIDEDLMALTLNQP